MILIRTKIAVGILFGFLRFFFGMLPVKLYKILQHWEGASVDSNTFVNHRRHEQVTCWITLCQSFGGGVLFATCFLHMMIQLFVSVEDLKNSSGVESRYYPLSQLTLSVGFFCVYFLEEWSHWVVEQKTDHMLATKTFEKIATSMSKCSTKISATDCNGDTPNRATRDNNRKIEDSEKEETPSDEELKMKHQEQLMRAILTIIALSLHSVLEGLSIGLKSRISEIWYLSVAVSIHSASILFCIGLELLLAKNKIRFIVLQVSVLALASPLGIFLGIFFAVETPTEETTKCVVAVLLEGLACGAILHITLFQVLSREKQRKVYRLRRSFCMVSGFVLMTVLQYVEMNYSDEHLKIVIKTLNYTRSN
ncbi:zinc transporter ZIP3-like [Cylas formicarius]|uniref:zinc transporter ZIP3-like n=1 Tax=Cylas formicarius TaxID=197179 RepID=UPI002958C52B|nr:zinc transporter ZIP3-like [Cylas formicarius]